VRWHMAPQDHLIRRPAGDTGSGASKLLPNTDGRCAMVARVVPTCTKRGQRRTERNTARGRCAQQRARKAAVARNTVARHGHLRPPSHLCRGLPPFGQAPVSHALRVRPGVRGALTALERRRPKCGQTNRHCAACRDATWDVHIHGAQRNAPNRAARVDISDSDEYAPEHARPACVDARARCVPRKRTRWWPRHVGCARSAATINKSLWSVFHRNRRGAPRLPCG